MKKGLVIFVAICIVASWVIGVAAYSLQEAMGQFVGLLFLPLMVLPLVAAFVSHRFTGAPGNPFAGLVWGPTGIMFGSWLLGLVIGYLAVAVSLGLGLQQLDLTLASYLGMVAEQSAAQGRELPEQAYSMIRITGWTTVIAMPLIVSWIGAAFACLGTFPMLGWFGRRVLVHGKLNTGLILAGIYLLITMPTGLIENPNLGEMAIPFRLLLMGLTGLASVPLLLWLFLKTRSAVIPALALTSIQMAAAGSVPLLTEGNPLLSGQSGLILQLVTLGAGLALWVWKDPGGDELAVAAVAFDGTPLTPAMVEQLQAEEAAHRAAAQAPATEEPGPPDPPASGGVADNS